MNVIWIENGLKVIQTKDGNLLFEAKCLDVECAEGFFTKTSYSVPPYCPSCGKDNTDYVSENDINTVEIRI